MNRLAFAITCLAFVVVACGDDSGTTKTAPKRESAADEIARINRTVNAETDRDIARSKQMASAKRKALGPITSATAPKCLKAAAALIKKGKACRIDMGRYSPEGICEEYIRGLDKSTDESAARRLNVINKRRGTNTACQTIRLAVKHNRI